MTGWRGIFAGMLALVALEAIVSRTESANRIGGALTGLAGMVEHLLSPSVALVPDLREKKKQADPSAPKKKKGGGLDLTPGFDVPGLPFIDYAPHRPATPTIHV